MKAFWNERYSESSYVYGEQPNEFFREQLQLLPTGKILLPAEGEGRNAVYAATLGWEVEAFDQSAAGQAKALQLAARNNVKINYQVNDLEDIHYESNNFDVIALVFAHFPASLRTAYHQKLLGFLKPGGTLLLQGFNKAQIKYQSGGPRDSSMLFSKEELLHDFNGLAITTLEELETTLQEGLYHNGTAALISLVAKKM